MSKEEIASLPKPTMTTRHAYSLDNTVEGWTVGLPGMIDLLGIKRAS